MLLGDRLTYRIKSSENAVPAERAQEPFLKRCIVQSGKKSTQCAGCLSTFVVLWMFGGLKTFFHRVNWLDFRIIFRCIFRYWDFLICFNRRKLVQRYLNWCEQETRNDVWWIFCGSNKQGQVDYCKAQNCWVLLVPNWFAWVNDVRKRDTVSMYEMLLYFYNIPTWNVLWELSAPVYYQWA